MRKLILLMAMLAAPAFGQTLSSAPKIFVYDAADAADDGVQMYRVAIEHLGMIGDDYITGDGYSKLPRKLIVFNQGSSDLWFRPVLLSGFAAADTTGGGGVETKIPAGDSIALDARVVFLVSTSLAAGDTLQVYAYD